MAVRDIFGTSPSPMAEYKSGFRVFKYFICFAFDLLCQSAFSCSLGAIGSEIGETRGERNYHASSYERHAADEIRNTCLTGEGGDIAECVSEVIKSTNEDQRAEDDRVAQSEMSHWAFYMLIATVIVAAITANGVVFVWLTLCVTYLTVSTLSDKALATESFEHVVEHGQKG